MSDRTREPLPTPDDAIDAAAPDEPVKPRLRGVLHQYAAIVAAAAGIALVASARGGTPRAVAAIYACSLLGLLTASAVYHRVTWADVRARRWMRRIDHSMIFVLIAGTYTPFAALVLDGGLADAVLVVVWVGAGAGVLLSMLWPDAPKWLSAGVYLALGWVGIVTMPEIASEAGPAALALLLAGGLLYSAGAVIYALRRPDPQPRVFGYHELFHLLVVVAAAAHFAAVAGFALPAG